MVTIGTLMATIGTYLMFLDHLRRSGENALDTSSPTVPPKRSTKPESAMPWAGARIVFLLTLMIISGHLGNMIDLKLGSLTAANWPRLVEEPRELVKFVLLILLFPVLTHTLLTILPPSLKASIDTLKAGIRRLKSKIG